VGDLELSQAAQQWVNVVLIWIGFGTLTGLAARVLVPGREPGLVGTMLIGVLGSTVGPLALISALGGSEFNPISPLGFLVSIGGAVVLLIVFRVFQAVVFAGQGSGRE
jgi:uncharacterized membrane protein YeaQ/YmgE (transglycosylase-associated protein family)